MLALVGHLWMFIWVRLIWLQFFNSSYLGQLTLTCSWIGKNPFYFQLLSDWPTALSSEYLWAMSKFSMLKFMNATLVAFFFILPRHGYHTGVLWTNLYHLLILCYKHCPHVFISVFSSSLFLYEDMEIVKFMLLLFFLFRLWWMYFNSSFLLIRARV